VRLSSRLIVNAAALVGRNVFGLAAAIVTTRLLLEALGSVDLGIFMLVGASTGLVMILVESLGAAASRHLAYEVGRGDEDAASRVFNTAVALHAGLGLAVVALGAALAGPVIGLLDIDPERTGAAAWTLFLAALTFGVISALSPWRAAAMAHEIQYVTAGAGVALSAARLAAAGLLLVAPGDALIVWATLHLVTQAAEGLLIMRLVTRRVFAVRLRPSAFTPAMLKPIAAFGGWTILGSLSWRLRMQFSQIALNQLFGSTVVNAAYGVGMQLGQAQQQVSTSLHTAVAPSVTVSAGGGKDETARRLILTGGKLGFVVTALLTVPIVAEAETLLTLWLGAGNLAELPSVVPIARAMAVMFLLNTLTRSFVAGINAHGRIGPFTLGTLAIDAATLLAGIAVVLVGRDFAAAGDPSLAADVEALRAGGPGPEWLPIVAAIGALAQGVFRVAYVSPKLGLERLRWVRESALPALIPVSVGVGVAAAIVAFVPAGVARLLLLAALSAAATLVVTWFFGLAAWEREHFRRIAGRIRDRLPGAHRGPPRSEPSTPPTPSAPPAPAASPPPSEGSAS